MSDNIIETTEPVDTPKLVIDTKPEAKPTEADVPAVKSEELKQVKKFAASVLRPSTAPGSTSSGSSAPKCPCCQTDARAIEAPDGYECLKCGTVFQTAVEPTLNGKTFGALYESAAPGDTFVFPGSELRSLRSLAQLADQNITSVYSNGGIVAALVRAGFHVSEHTPDVTFVKPIITLQE